MNIPDVSTFVIVSIVSICKDADIYKQLQKEMPLQSGYRFVLYVAAYMHTLGHTHKDTHIQTHKHLYTHIPYIYTDTYKHRHTHKYM